MNDPMEGVYNTSKKHITDKIFDQKNKYVICSFSHSDALELPMLWGYYANGYKGIAIEIEYDGKIIYNINNNDNINNCIVKVKYVEEIEDIDNSNVSVPKIISSKLKCWEDENEYRYLTNSEPSGLIKIGEIKTVYFGDPYGSIYNKREIVSESKTMKCYNEYVKYLWQCCKNNHIEPVLYDGYQKKKDLPDLPNEPKLSDDCKPRSNQNTNGI
ncbi:DUF2971 domain-containing protein [Methanosarcina mazei]|uniref:DUF2971 domain-containing protein n=1 Tax=Methanosarcina mazei TaxID=2209 RepID=UPI003C75BADB